MNNFTKLSLVATLLFTITFSSCKKEYENIQTIDDDAIQAYLKRNNLNFSKDTKGYYYNIITPGSGVELKPSDSVYYSYTIKLLNGQVLNRTSDLKIPGTFLGYTDRFIIGGLGYVFTPIREVLTKLKRGGKATLIMPSNMAFGKNGSSAINVGSNENILVDLSIYEQAKRHEIDELEINKFIADKNLTMIKDVSRSRYNIITQGTGTDVIGLNSTIAVNYTGRYLDGTVFDSSANGKFSSILSDLVKGWRLILPGKVTAGGKIRLIIPADLAYGTTPLDFDIEIVSVTN